MYHIFHIFHRLGRFSGSSSPMSFLPISPRYFFQFPIFFPARRSSHFPNSWPIISLVLFLPDVTFSVFLSSWLFLRIFPIPCHLFHSCHGDQLSNAKFSPCLFFCYFSFFSFHYSFPLFPNFRTFSQYSACSSKCSLPTSPLIPKSSSRSVFHLAYLLFVSRWRVFLAVFLLGFRLSMLTPSYSWDSVLLDWSSTFSSSLLLPLAANFHYCQSSLTFPSTLYFPKFQFINTLSVFP